jgi:hypothetical protein
MRDYESNPYMWRGRPDPSPFSLRRALAALAITAAVLAGFGVIIATSYVYPIALAGVAVAVFVGTLAWVIYDMLGKRR